MEEKEQAGNTTPCDVVLISGFLGAGKTTLLRRILQWPGDLSKTAILVNEFGEVGIDGDLLKGFDTPVVELRNGCICCSMGGDLVRTVEKMIDDFHPERLLIEATGVADPHEILSYLQPFHARGLISTPKVVTVLSADFWEARECFGHLFFDQIESADMVLFNKIDLLPAENIPIHLEEVRQLNKGCSLLPTHRSEIDPEALWLHSVQPGQERKVTLPRAHIGHGSAHEMGYLAFSFENESPFRADCFHRFIQALPATLYRMKGFVRLDDKRFFINHVGGRTEWIEQDLPGATKLAFVGWQVDEGRVIDELKSCLVQTPAE